ncbi:MAG: hypothetical protein FJZ93_01015, partial [Chloroflexi bacterium]|nr:hypothetical protein [Chloroflexota bacterium]
MNHLRPQKIFLTGVALLLLLLPVAACAPKAPPPPPPAPPAGTIAVEPAKIDMDLLKTNFEILVKLRRYTPEVAAKLPVQLGLLVQPVTFIGEGWPANEMVFVDLVIPPDVEMKGLDRSRGEDSV